MTVYQMVPDLKPRIVEDVKKWQAAFEEVVADFTSMKTNVENLNKEVGRLRRLDHRVELLEIKQARLNYRQVVNVWTKKIVCPAMEMKWEDVHPKLRKEDPVVLRKLRGALKRSGVSLDEWYQCRLFHWDVSTKVAHGKFENEKDAKALLEVLPPQDHSFLNKVLEEVVTHDLADEVYEIPPRPDENPRPLKQSRHK